MFERVKCEAASDFGSRIPFLICHKTVGDFVHHDRKYENEDVKDCIHDLHCYKSYDTMRIAMAKVCAVTKKSSLMAAGYSNSVRATKFNPTGARRKYANLHKKRIFVPELNKTFVLTLSTDAIKTINKRGAYVTLKKAGIIK